MTVPELIRLLAKPIYVWRMAQGMIHSPHEAQRKSAQKRQQKAESEIREIVEKFKP